MSEWKPIVSAPRDGTAILGYCEAGPVVVIFHYGYWSVENSHGYNEDGEVRGLTHWMPLPEPPVTP